MKPGDILHITRMTGTRYPEQDAWAVVTGWNDHMRNVDTMVILDQCPAGYRWFPGELGTFGSHYIYDIVPDAEVPDHIWVALARIKLCRSA